MKRILGKRAPRLYDPQQVLYLIGNINYCYLYLIDGQVLLSCRTLKWFSDQWPGFLRVHKNSLVNRCHIQTYQISKTTSSHIVMVNQTRIDIARRRTEAVMKFLQEADQAESLAVG